MKARTVMKMRQREGGGGVQKEERPSYLIKRDGSKLTGHQWKCFAVVTGKRRQTDLNS